MATITETDDLRWLKFVILRYFKKELLDKFGREPTIDIVEHVGFSYDEIAVRIIQKVYGKQQIVTVSYPADWWQAFKERWFPAWLLTRYPVQFKIHTITASELYPKVALPDEERHIMVGEYVRVGREDDEHHET